MTEAKAEYIRNCISCVIKSTIISLILVVIDYFWPYDRRTTCHIKDDGYTYNPSCDTEEDWGRYDRHTTFKVDCSQIIYETERECISPWSDTYIAGEQYVCWTNHSCSIQPIFDNWLLREWPWNIWLIPAMIVCMIAIITSIEVLVFLINVYRTSSHEFWNVISMAIYQRIALNSNVNTELFMNGYFREIQIASNMEEVIIPLDIIKLCLRFYSMDTHTFNQYTLSIENPMRPSIESVAEKKIFIESCIKNAKQKRYEYGVALLFILSLYVAIFMRKQWNSVYDQEIEVRIKQIHTVLLLVGIYFIFSFLCYYYMTLRLSMYSYYYMTPWDDALHFDVETRYIKSIEYCVDYSDHDAKEPLIYIRNTDNICKFEQLTAVLYDIIRRDSENVYVLQLESMECKYIKQEAYCVEINANRYQDILTKMKQIMQGIDSLWEKKVRFEVC